MMLEVKNLNISFKVKEGILQAVRGVCFSMEAGESLGIVGESGCGKTALARALNHLHNDAFLSGDIFFEGKKQSAPSSNIGMIFQDPFSALNPTMRIGDQVAESLLIREKISKKEAYKRALELLKLVQIPSPEEKMEQYPHQLSGGQRQRVLIASMVISHPKLLIADEPTTALDKETEKQVLSLLKDLKKRFSMALIIISHDFSVVAELAEKILVLYAGKIVEFGRSEEVLKNPRHPYTQMLLKSTLRWQNPFQKLFSMEGSPPDLSKPLRGCSFRSRCPYRALKCIEEPSGPIACWRAK